MLLYENHVYANYRVSLSTNSNVMDNAKVCDKETNTPTDRTNPTHLGGIKMTAIF